MGRRIYVLLLLLIAISILPSAYSYTDIFLSDAIYPEDPTIYDEFTACVLLDPSNPCVDSTLTISCSSYVDSSSSSLNLVYPLRDYIRMNHFMIDELPENDIWCARISAWGDIDRLRYYAECKDSLNNIHTDSLWVYPYLGTIYINTTYDFEKNRMFVLHTGEEMDIEVYTDSYPDNNIYYSLYNITLGTPYIDTKKMIKTEGQYHSTFTIDPAYPTGFIEIFTDLYPYGGKFISYAAIPYRYNISIDGDTYMGDIVDITFDLEMDYGSINNIVTNMVLPNGTIQRIYLDNVNTSIEYSIPMSHGNYTIEFAVNHSVLEDNIIRKRFVVPAYDLDVDSGKLVYFQGDTVTFELGLLDSRNNPVDSDYILYIKNPDSGTDIFDEADMTETNNYYKMTYPLAKDAPVGEYNITVKATDEYGNSYTETSSFIVNIREKFLNYSLSPNIIDLDMYNIDETDIHVVISNDGDTDIDEINLDTVDLDEDFKLSDIIDFETTNLSGDIDVGESEEFIVIIAPPIDTESGYYYGNISVESDGIYQYMSVMLNLSLIPRINVSSSISAIGISGKSGSILVPLKSIGAKDITGLTANVSGNMKDVVEGIDAPYTIKIKQEADLAIRLKSTAKEGKYEGDLTFNAPSMNTAKSHIKLEIVSDFNDRIDEAKTKLNTLKGIYENLDLDTITDDMTYGINTLDEDVSRLDELYSSGDYTQAKTLLEDVEELASELESDLSKYESVVKETCGDGICDIGEDCPEDCESSDDIDYGNCNHDDYCDIDENCDCADCLYDASCSDDDSDYSDSDSDDSGGGSSSMLIIIIIVVLVVVVVIVATSIVPDDNQSMTGLKPRSAR